MSTAAATGAAIALGILGALVQSAPEVIEIVTGQDRKTLAERIERARKAFDKPIDTTEADDERRERLIRIVRGG